MNLKNGFNWITGLFVIGYHLFLLIALPIYFMHHTPSLKLIVISAVLVFITGMSITTGYHRFYSHLTYKTNKWIEAIMLFFGSMSTQGSALRWAFDHRLHHAFVDTDKDPYSINKGFWYAHILWLFEKPREIDNKVVSDLTRNKLVMFQHKYYGLSMLVTNAIAFLAVGWMLGDYLGAFIFAWWVRLFFLHHFTWFINSLAHTWGSQSFSREHSAVDNYIISLLTFGEGYHNYHHTFANDYRNGIRWYHFDPSKWLIWTLGKLGLAHSIKQVNHYRITERILMDRQNELLERIKNSYQEHKTLWEEKVAYITSNLVAKLNKMNQLIEQYNSAKKMGETGRELLDNLKTEIDSLKKSLKDDWRSWKELSKNIQKLKHATT